MSEPAFFVGCSVSYILAMDRKTYELVGPGYPGNRPEDVRDPSLGWIISFLFLIAFLGPFSIVLLRKVPFLLVGKSCKMMTFELASHILYNLIKTMYFESEHSFIKLNSSRHT